MDEPTRCGGEGEGERETKRTTGASREEVMCHCANVLFAAEIRSRFLEGEAALGGFLVRAGADETDFQHSRHGRGEFLMPSKARLEISKLIITTPSASCR